MTRIEAYKKLTRIALATNLKSATEPEHREFRTLIDIAQHIIRCEARLTNEDWGGY